MATRRRRKAPSEEERAERRAAERELMAGAIEQLRSSEGWQRWLRVRRHFHSYSLHNQLLIAFQCPGATRVAGFRRWLSLGYAVRKGEHGIRIWAPCPPSAKKLRGMEGRPARTRAHKPRTYFRLVAGLRPLPGRAAARVPRRPGRARAADRAGRGRRPRRSLRAAGGLRRLDRLQVAVEEIPGSARGYCAPGRQQIGVEPVAEEFSRQRPGRGRDPRARPRPRALRPPRGGPEAHLRRGGGRGRVRRLHASARRSASTPAVLGPLHGELGEGDGDRALRGADRPLGKAARGAALASERARGDEEASPPDLRAAAVHRTAAWLGCPSMARRADAVRCR